MAQANPNVSRQTNEMWTFWLWFHKLEPTAKLAGFFADKPGYHNSRRGNSARDYSVISAIDRRGPADKASAIDLTFPDAQRGDYRTIVKYTRRLLASGRDLKDERGNYLREFFGTLDGKTVCGWDFQAVQTSRSTDTTHTWHLHISVSRGYSTFAKAMRALLSILAGVTVKVWRAAEAALLKPRVVKPVIVKQPPVPPGKVVVTPPVIVLPPPAAGSVGLPGLSDTANMPGAVIIAAPVTTTPADLPPIVVLPADPALPTTAPPPPPARGFWAQLRRWLVTH